MAAVNEGAHNINYSTLLQQILDIKGALHGSAMMEKMDQAKAQGDAVSHEHEELKKQLEELESELQNQSVWEEKCAAIRRETEEIAQLNQTLREEIRGFQEKHRLFKTLEGRREAVVRENAALRQEIEQMYGRLGNTETIRKITSELASSTDDMARETEALKKELQLLTIRYEKESTLEM